MPGDDGYGGQPGGGAAQHAQEEEQGTDTRHTGSRWSSDILSIQTPEEEAKIKAKKQLKLDIQVGIDNAHRYLDTE